MSSVENKLKIQKVGSKGFGLQRSKFAWPRLDFLATLLIKLYRLLSYES